MDLVKKVISSIFLVLSYIILAVYAFFQFGFCMVRILFEIIESNLTGKGGKSNE